MDVLPANQRLRRRDAFHSLALAPLEYITKSLRMGDEWELEELQDFARRCRALADAFDARMEQAKGSK